MQPVFEELLSIIKSGANLNTKLIPYLIFLIEEKLNKFDPIKFPEVNKIVLGVYDMLKNRPSDKTAARELANINNDAMTFSTNPDENINDYAAYAARATAIHIAIATFGAAEYSDLNIKTNSFAKFSAAASSLATYAANNITEHAKKYADEYAANCAQELVDVKANTDTAANAIVEAVIRATSTAATNTIDYERFTNKLLLTIRG